MNRIDTCKYFNGHVCEISHMKTDTCHCNGCISYEEKQKCSVCDEYMNEEFYHKWDIGNLEYTICEDCFNDEKEGF